MNTEDQALEFYESTAKRLLARGVDKRRFGGEPDVDLLLQTLCVDGVNYTVHELANGFVEARRKSRVLTWGALTLAVALAWPVLVSVFHA